MDRLTESRAIAGLIRAGVSMEDATNLIGAALEDPQRVLALIVLPAEPRPGDRVRRIVREGQAESIVVLARAETSTPMRWAVLGEPVVPSARDDVALGKGAR